METTTDTARFVTVGPFQLDVNARELRSGETRVRLQDQPFEILRLMLERPGEVVTREALRRRLWPDGTFVDFEHSLNAAVKRLRAALGDDADNPRFVETLPRRGYRLIAARGAAPASGVAPRPQPRLAVLPFANLSGAGDDEYLGAGLTDELIGQIGTLCRGRVGVLARWSSMHFKLAEMRARDIGEALRAGYLLEGSVRREADRVRITARLVDAASETQLWSEAYERHLSEHGSATLLSVQTEVATRVARSLATELGPAPPPTPPVSPAAYQAMLKGRYHWNALADTGLDRAMACFEEALALAPSHAPAMAAVARGHVARAEYYRHLPRQALDLAAAMASRALEIDPSLCEAHLAAADVSRMRHWDWSGAEEAYGRAQALNPSAPAPHRCLAWMLAGLGRFDEAVRASDRAFEIDPLCLDAGVAAAWIRYAADDVDAAIDYCRNTLDMDPSFAAARRVLGAAYLRVGRAADAIDELRTAAAASPASLVAELWLAHALAAGGARGDAEALVSRVLASGAAHVPAYHLALAHAGLANLDAAFAALDEAWLDRDPALGYLLVEPRFAPLRADRRFAVLAGRLGLV